MKKYFTYLVGALSALCVGSANADVENWYSYWSLGIADHQYEEPLDSTIKSIDAVPGVSRSEVAVDMLGFYWPVGDQSSTIVGFVINGSADRLDDSYDYIQINHYLYGASVMHFFGQEPGDGFFVRGDFGIAKASVTDSFGYSSTSDSGTGYLIGIGYGIPMSSDSRLLLSVTSSTRSIEDEDYSAIAFTVGGLW
jgi:opacity protein-like surface antigen